MKLRERPKRPIQALKSLLQIIGVSAVSVMCSSALAATVTYDFTENPANDPNFIISSNNPDPWKSEGGNPGGYYAITEAVDSQYSQLLFPDFDNGLIVKAFTFECDLRIGNSSDSDGRPADGFSINYARANDPQVLNLLANRESADNGGYAASGAPETGTTTGVAVLFDTWAGNALPDGPDIEGIIVRVDNVTATRVSLPVRNGACNDTNSLQTGPWDSNMTGLPDDLCWQKFKVELAENGQLTVTYKGRVLLDKFATGFIPSAGRLLFAGRTGGNNENHHVDNVKITTVAAETVLFTGVSSTPYGVVVTLSDAGPSVLDPATVVLSLDGAPVPNAQLQLSKTGGDTKVTYTGTTLLVPGSQHRVDLTFKDTRGIAGSGGADFTVAPYAVIPASFADANVNKTQPGFRVHPYQTEAAQPNSLQWTEEQLAGKHGPNIADLTAADAQGFYNWPGVVNFNIDAPNNAGNFNADTGNTDQTFPGIPGMTGSTGNATEEIITYLEFPAAGVYQMGVNSDDGFRVTSARNAMDKLGVILGQFDGGRGATDTIFTFVLEAPGTYPFRLIWENGNGELPGNGANLEWFTVRDGQKILVNDTTNPNAVKAYRTSTSSPAYVSAVTPIPNSTGIPADQDIRIEVTHGAAAVDTGSVQMTLNGAPVTPTASTAGNVTTITYPSAGPLPPNSQSVVTLGFRDTATPAVQYNYTLRFSVPNYLTVPTALLSPLGSQDTTKPGFNVKTVQLDARYLSDGTLQTQPNNNEWAEGVLAGLVGPNVADLTAFTGGIYPEPSTINYSHTEGDMNGNFTPDRQHPGIPGTTGITDNYASEFVTYIPFAAPGYYTMGVNSDDNFRLTIGEQVGRQYLQVEAPASIAGGIAAVATSSPLNVNPGFGGPLPTTPITADAVVLGTSCLADPALPDLTGKIAVIPRGTCTFVEKARNAQSKGAVAVVIANNQANEGAFPIVMGGDGIDVTIPVMMLDYDDGQKLINNPTGLRLSIGKDTNFQLGEFNGNGRGATDTLFSFYVPRAGVYPFRLFYMQGGGGGNVEWFTVAKDGTRVLVNDSAAAALKGYRARTFVPAPTLSVTQQGGNVVINFTGTLQAADEVTGPYTDLAGTSPITIPATGAKKFFRSKQ